MRTYLVRPDGFIVVSVLFVGAFGLGYWALPRVSGHSIPSAMAEANVGESEAQGVDTWALHQRSATASARKALLNGEEVGEVLVEGRVSLRIRTVAAGKSPYQRAEVMAYRLNTIVNDGGNPADIRAGRMEGYAAVMWGDQILLTVDGEQARLTGLTPYGLAQAWAADLRAAYGVEDVTEAKGPASEAKGVAWRPAEPYDDRYVPIVSLGRGTRVGAARINGPRSQLQKVSAVAQLEAKYSKFVEIEAYVPVSTEDLKHDLGRVQGVGVTGVGDFRF